MPFQLFCLRGSLSGVRVEEREIVASHDLGWIQCFAPITGRRIINACAGTQVPPVHPAWFPSSHSVAVFPSLIPYLSLTPKSSPCYTIFRKWTSHCDWDSFSCDRSVFGKNWRSPCRTDSFHPGLCPLRCVELPFVEKGEGRLLGFWAGSLLCEAQLSHQSISPELYPVFSLQYSPLLPRELDTFFICLSLSKFGAFSYHELCLECSLPSLF